MPTRVHRVATTGPLAPSGIFAEVESRPPLMREQAKAKYLGKQVKWALAFLDGRAGQDGEARLTFHFDPQDIRMVSGSVRLSDYPRLRSTSVGERIRVRGTIRKVDALCIELDIRDLVFAKAAEAVR